MVYYIIYYFMEKVKGHRDMNAIKTLKNTAYGKHALKAFLLGLLLSALLVVPVIIQQGGLFLYYGDFNAQEVPFYQLMHDEFLKGNFGWTNLTDLGTASVSSYMFYICGSPFFWITLLFPSEAVPYLMGPLLMLKFAFASLTAYLYLKRYVKNKNLAVAGALMYAFSGFSVYNIFFFHFHEPMIVFPLLLLAVDEFMYNNRRGVVALAVFSSCIVNYYFFAGMAVFTAMYWLILVFTNTYKITLSKILFFALEVVLGFLATAFVLLPTVLFIMGNPRLSSFPDGYGALVYENAQRYAYIISSFFFPPEMPAQPNFTPEVNANWASVSGWLPLAGMTGVIAYLQLKKRDWLKKLLFLLILCALVPAFNSLFQMLNSSIFYARWYYMFTLITALATIRALEEREADWGRAFAWSAGITAGIALLIGLMPNTTYDNEDVPSTALGLEEYIVRYWIYVAVAMFSLAAFAMIVFAFKRDRRKLGLLTIAGVCLVSLLSSTYIVQTGNSLDHSDKKFIKNYAINAADKLDIDDLKEVRSDFYECPDNTQMFWQIQSINTFHSVVSTSIMDFYDAVGITRDVASRPETDNYGLRGLFSCKYLFDEIDDNDEDEYSFINEDERTKMPGWKFKENVNGCRVYENEYYIPMGFTYDRFISESELRNIDSRHSTEAVLKALALGYDDLLKYREITGYTEDDIKQLKKDDAKKKHKFDSITKQFEYGEIEYFKDCKKLKENTAEVFEYTKDGFKAEFDNKGGDNLLFFSVPYDQGWSAEVNGKKAEIVKAQVGFMAVKVKGQEKSSIVFKYEPFGFRIGIIISVICGIIFFMYLAALTAYKIIRKKRE